MLLLHDVDILQVNEAHHGQDQGSDLIPAPVDYNSAIDNELKFSIIISKILENIYSNMTKYL